jgi:hypothetical protein
LENDVLGNVMGLEALVGALTRATEALLKRKNKKGNFFGIYSPDGMFQNQFSNTADKVAA